MPGPLPTGEAARRNKPVIPTTNLPAGGRDGDAPEWPDSVELKTAGQAWWDWAWHTPQAAGWSLGDLYYIAHRAQLEDDIKALDSEDFAILDDVLSFPDQEASQLIGSLINRLKALATGKASLLSRVNDMDDKLGLTPKGMAALRWKIVEEDKPQEGVAPTGGRKGLTLVDKSQAS